MHEKRIEIRWRDLDALGHVNNAVYFTYLEEVQADWLERILDQVVGAAAEEFVTARVAIDYRRALRLADREVVGRSTLVRIGRSSVTARSELYTTAGRLVAEAETVLVARDPGADGSRPLTDHERNAFEREAARASDTS